jgi:S-formylglutathione hydrolase FrmB
VRPILIRCLLFLGLLAATIVALPREAEGAPTAAPACPPDRCTVHRVPAPKHVHVTDDRVTVILPIGYTRSHRRYPVIYLFNGVVGPFNEWIVNSDIGRYSARFPAIFVDMAAGDQPNAGYFSDWLDGSYQWESWHVRTVIPWVDAHFRTIKGDRAAIGVSIGGTGALNYQEHHPGLFRTIASFSGLVDTQWAAPASGYELTQADPTIKRVWGDQVFNSPVWAAHNPTASAAKLRGAPLFLACGTGSPSAGTDIHGPQEEFNIFGDHTTFLTALTAAGVTHTDRFYAGGSHAWSYFQQDLHWALPQMMTLL